MAKLILLACGRLQEIEQVRDSIDYVQFTCTGLVAKAIKIHIMLQNCPSASGKNNRWKLRE